MVLFDTFVVPSLSLIEQLIIGGLLLVSLVVVYYATIRLFNPSPIRFLLVLIANVFSVIAVIFLIIPIQVKHAENEKIILLTNGYHQSLFNQVDFDKNESIQREVSNESVCHANTKIYYLKAASNLDKVVAANVDNSKITDCKATYIEINHISELSTFEPNLQQLNIYGNGLSSSQWQQLESMKVQFFPSKLTSGFIDLQWGKEATLGESINFTATLQISRESNRFERIHTVHLIDVNGDLLAEVKAKHGETFTFNFTPKTIGQHIYRIHLLEKVAIEGKEHSMLIDDPIAVNITESVLPKVLIIQSSPQYETKHFKHWLTENNGKLLTLTQISKNHVMTEAVNLANDLSANINLSAVINTKINKVDDVLTAEIFNQFELLIIDAKALLSIESDKLSLLEKAVHNGLGLLVNVDNRLIKAIDSNEIALLNRFQQFSKFSNSNENKSAENNAKQVRLNWLNNSSEHLIDTNNIDLRTFSAKPLVFDQQKQPLLISNNVGKGRIALTTISSSFQLKLNGLSDKYSQLWQFITTELASNQQPMFWLPQPKNKVIFKGDMAKACLLAERDLVLPSKAKPVKTRTAKVFQLNSQTDQTVLSLDSQPESDNQYCSVYLSEKVGWQQLLFSVENNSKNILNNSQYIYHYDENDWLAWQQYLTHSISAEKANKSKLVNEKAINEDHLTPVNKLVVFLMLFISSSFLWIERKLY